MRGLRRGLVRRRKDVVVRQTQTDRLLNFHRGVASVLNSTAEAVGIDHRVRVVEVPKGTPTQAPPPPKERSPPKLRSALTYMTQSDIENYAGRHRLLEIKGLPSSVEKFVYAHCVKIFLCLLQDACEKLKVKGFAVKTTTTRRVPTERSTVDGSTDVRKVAKFVDCVIDVEERTPLRPFERVLHYNVACVILHLVADLCSSFRVDFFGHSLRVALAPNDDLLEPDVDAMKRQRDARRRTTGPLFDDDFVSALTDEILADNKDIALALVPDFIEANFYRQFFSFYGVLLDYALASSFRLSVLDVQATLAVKDDPS
mmetsp:Transcript_20127/g.64823  ORF Transcript_20127/g.64823 Transcript_20127/m.64823 type:complete len:314 (-) Transcript_20127:34-975(-)